MKERIMLPTIEQINSQVSSNLNGKFLCTRDQEGVKEFLHKDGFWRPGPTTTVDGKIKYSGYFDKPEDAVKLLELQDSGFIYEGTEYDAEGKFVKNQDLEELKVKLEAAGFTLLDKDGPGMAFTYEGTDFGAEEAEKKLREILDEYGKAGSLSDNIGSFTDKLKHAPIDKLIALFEAYPGSQFSKLAAKELLHRYENMCLAYEADGEQDTLTYVATTAAAGFVRRKCDEWGYDLNEEPDPRDKIFAADFGRKNRTSG